MPKETVRYPDALVAGVEAVVAESEAFESKSEFYRFASDFLLAVLDEDHDPTVLGYGDIVADLESSSGGRLASRTDAGEPSTGPFLDAYIQVRRHLLYDDVESARGVVADRYDPTDREALLLDEVIGRERLAAPAIAHTGATESAVRENDGESGDGRDSRGGDSRGTSDGGSADETLSSRGRPAEERGRLAGPTRETDGGTEGHEPEDT